MSSIRKEEEEKCADKLSRRSDKFLADGRSIFGVAFFVFSDALEWLLERPSHVEMRQKCFFSDADVEETGTYAQTIENFTKLKIL